MSHPTRGALSLIPAILLLVLVGGVLVAYLWETLNRLMSGFVEPTRLLISLPVLILFAFLLRLVARAIERWHGPHEA